MKGKHETQMNFPKNLYLNLLSVYLLTMPRNVGLWYVSDTLLVTRTRHEFSSIRLQRAVCKTIKLIYYLPILDSRISHSSHKVQSTCKRILKCLLCGTKVSLRRFMDPKLGRYQIWYLRVILFLLFYLLRIPGKEP